MPIIYLYTFCWNEIDILPYVVDYWKHLNITKAIVYDNGSTDGSIEFLQKFDFIEVRSFITEDGTDNLVIRYMKNTIWKEARNIADLVIVCDLDEIIYCKDPENIFNKIKEDKITLCDLKWFTYISKEYPTYTEGKLLHEISPYVYLGAGAKMLLFNPNEIKEINYSVGAHECKPIGNINQKEIDNMYIIHIHKNLSLEFFLKKYEILNNRRSLLDKSYNHGNHYEQPKEKLIQNYNNWIKNSFNFNDYINGDNN